MSQLLLQFCSYDCIRMIDGNTTVILCIVSDKKYLCPIAVAVNKFTGYSIQNHFHIWPTLKYCQVAQQAVNSEDVTSVTDHRVQWRLNCFALDATRGNSVD
jgi:hypothetical protein